MFALAAAVMFLIYAIKIGTHVDAFWFALGLCLWALHFAFDVALPALSRRQQQPPE